jgi:hypothetical protein
MLLHETNTSTGIEGYKKDLDSGHLPGSSQVMPKRKDSATRYRRGSRALVQILEKFQDPSDLSVNLWLYIDRCERASFASSRPCALSLERGKKGHWSVLMFDAEIS